MLHLQLQSTPFPRHHIHKPFRCQHGTFPLQACLPCRKMLCRQFRIRRLPFPKVPCSCTCTLSFLRREMLQSLFFQGRHFRKQQTYSIRIIPPKQVSSYKEPLYILLIVILISSFCK